MLPPTDFNGVALNTVFITGNIQKIGEGLLAWAWPHKDPKAPKSEGLAIFALVWIAYAVGALTGAILERQLSQPLWIPAAILPLIMAGNGPIGRRAAKNASNG